MEIERARYARNVGKALEALANDAPIWETGRGPRVVASLLQIGARRLEGGDGSDARASMPISSRSDGTWWRACLRAAIRSRCFRSTIVTGSDEHAHLPTPSRRN